MHHTHICFYNVTFIQLYTTLKDMLEAKNVFQIFFVRFYLQKSVSVSMKVTNIRNLYHLFMQTKLLQISKFL